jgi:nucleosome binding factor SPN SPT16 subunit
MVKKPDGTWRMCVDYTDLNKAHPKNEYPLLRIDQIVDLSSECKLLCFLDAYSGYHQISMCIDDEEKTTSVTPFGV